MCNNPVFHKVNDHYQLIPCNNCLGCRVDKTLLWQTRCNIEYIRPSSRSAFVTFTYDDLHLPYNENALLPTIREIDFHHYVDNLRHKVKKMSALPFGCRKDFAFFGCMEYGDSFARPHAHILFFGLDFADCKKIFVDSWKNGSVKSLPVFNGGIRYVVDYMSKNLNGDIAVAEYDDTLRERPFFSNSKGLGSSLFYAHREEINATGLITLGSRHIPCPTYYKNLLMDFSPSSIRAREKVQLDFYKSMVSLAKKQGFNNYDDFIAYKRRADELSLLQKFRSKGIPCDPSYNGYESLADGYVPARISHILSKEAL